jgi:hypothetical protein
MFMRWLKRDMWKAGIAIAGMLLLLVLMTWIPFLAVGAHGKLQPGPAFAVGTGTAQATSTVDLTVTALAKDQLQQQDEKLQRENSGLWPFWATISDSIGGSIGGLGTACLAIAAYVTARYGLRQWHVNRQDEQKKREEKQERWRKEREEKQRKRDEERFQIVVERLSREREEARVGGAIVLRTFLQEGYEQFYSQAFDLAVAHLCLSKASDPLKDPDVLSQALIGVFKEAFPLARDEWIKKQKGEPFPPRSRSWSRSRSLDASRIQLDKAFLWNADLKLMVRSNGDNLLKMR